MKYWYDSEFIDDGKTIDLISIGIVAEDGRELYFQSCEFDASKASPWVEENVINHLVECRGGSRLYHDLNLRVEKRRCMGTKLAVGCPWRTREQIKTEILAFMDIETYGKPELWGWCSGYDWVAFCQIFGTMMDLPKGYPHYIKDLQHILDERGISDDELPKQEEGLHNALQDALHLKRLWGYIVRNDCWQ